MGNANPSPSQILAALQAEGVDVQTYKGWDTVGRPWRGPDGSPGLTGMVIHHTSTASATGSSGCPSLWWAVNAYERPVCNLLIGRGPGDTYLLSAGSAYHCGLGGPIPELGVPYHGFYGQTRLFGIELDDAGLVASSLTPYQLEQVAKTIAALSKLTGFDIDEAVLTHKCYTDGCHTKAKSPLPSLGRKNDTIDGAWRQFPGDANPEPYNAPFWRELGKGRLQPALWDGTVPSQAAVIQTHPMKGEEGKAGNANRANYRVLCRLIDLGYGSVDDLPEGRRAVYPARLIKKFRKANGLGSSDGFSLRIQKRMFGKTKP